MTVLSSSYGIILDSAIISPGHGKNGVDGIRATGKRYLNGDMEPIGKLVSNYTTNIGMLPSASKYFSVKFVDQCLHILNNIERLNGLKGITKKRKTTSQFKYQSRISSVQRNSGVYQRGMKMRWNNKLFLSLNSINGKTSPYASKGILRHYHYRLDVKFGPDIVVIRIIPCICHACTVILSIS